MFSSSSQSTLRTFLSAGLVLIFSVHAPLSTAFAAGGSRPMIEVGVSIGGSHDALPNATEVPFSGSVSADARLNFLFLDAQAEFTSYGVDGSGFSEDYSVRASGGLFFLKVHEFYMRKDPANGDHTHTMAGFGGSYDLPGDIGEITASLGAIVMDWERKGSGTGTNNSLIGGYAGANVFLHVWKFENELRIAYYASPELNIEGAIAGQVNDAVGGLDVSVPDGQGGTVSADVNTNLPTPNGTQLISGWTTGMMLSNTLRFKVISIPMLTFGPEARFSMMQLPDGTEFVTTIGFGGRFGL